MAALESGQSEVLTQYLERDGKVSHLQLRQHHAHRSPEARRQLKVAGIRTWNSLGRFVKRGEKGIFILAPMVGRRSLRRNSDRRAEAKTADERKPQQQLYGFRAVYVFDVSQTEGKELPTLTEVEGDVSGYRERLSSSWRAQNIKLSYSEKIAPAKGLSSGGRDHAAFRDAASRGVLHARA